MSDFDASIRETRFNNPRSLEIVSEIARRISRACVPIFREAVSKVSRRSFGVNLNEIYGSRGAARYNAAERP